MISAGAVNQSHQRALLLFWSLLGSSWFCQVTLCIQLEGSAHFTYHLFSSTVSAVRSHMMSSLRLSHRCSLSLLSLSLHICFFFCLSTSLLTTAQPSLPPGIPTLTIADNFNFTIPPPLSPTQIYDAIAALPYQYSSEAHRVRSHLPRFSGPDYFPLTDSSERDEWIKGTVFYIIPGVVMAIVMAASWLVLSVYLCCRTRDYSKAGYDYSAGSQSTAVLLCLFALLAVIFASVGLAYNHYVTDGLTGGDNQPSMIVTSTSITFVSSGSSSSGVTTAAADILNSLNVFFSAFPQLLQNLIGTIDTTVGQVSGNITDASGLVQQVQVLAVAATATVNSILNVSVAGYGCNSACSAALSPLVDVTNQLNGELLPVVQVIEYDIDSINNQILTSQQSITNGLNSAISQLNGVNTTISSHESDVNTAISDIRKYNHDREVATVILLILPFLCLPLIVLAFVLRSATLWKVNLHWMVFISIIMWLLFAVHLAITSAISDTCIYADGAELNLTAHFDTQTTAVLQACLLNTSLLTAVNVTESLSFAFSIELPNVTSIEQLVDVSELDNLTSSITSSTLLTAIGFNASAIAYSEQTALNTLNQLTTPDYYTLANISTVNPNNYPSNSQQQIASLQSTILQLQQAQSALTSLASTIQSNVSSLVAGVTGVEAEANRIFSSFANVAATIAPVVNDGQQVIESAYCGVLGNDYYEAKNSFCTTVQRGAGMIAVSTFLIALFLVPAIVLSCIRADQQDESDMAGKEGATLSSPGSPGSLGSPAYVQTTSPPMPSSPVQGSVPTLSNVAPPVPTRPPRAPRWSDSTRWLRVDSRAAGDRTDVQCSVVPAAVPVELRSVCGSTAIPAKP